MALDRDPNHVFRDFVTNGLPSSGKHHPRKPEMRALFTEWWQTLIALVADAGGLELPNLLISMTVTGGDENNLVAEANLPVPSGPGVAVFSIVIVEANTGPVTINGKPLLSNTGNPLVAGALAADGIYLLLDNGDSYRLLSDYVSSSIVPAAEAAAVIASEAAGQAVNAAGRAENAAAGVEFPVSYAPQTLTEEQQEQARLNLGLYLSSDFTVNIPSDFATMQAAVDFFHQFRVAPGAHIILNIESGHALTHGLIVRNGDYRHFKIVSEDAVVPLAADFVGAAPYPDQPTLNTSNCIIVGVNAGMPLLSCIIDAGGKARNGYFAMEGSTGRTDRIQNTNDEEPSPAGKIAGVINCTHFNIRIRGAGTINCRDALATGAGINGIYGNGTARIAAEFADASGAGQYGFCANRGTIISAGASRANDCGSVGYRALRGGRIEAEVSEANNCGVGFLATLNASIYCQGSSATGATVKGVEGNFRGCGVVAVRGSEIVAQSVDVSASAKYGHWAAEGSRIVCRFSNAQNCGESGVYCDMGSTMDANAINTSGAAQVGIDAANGSTVNASGSTANNCGVAGIRARFAAQVGAINSVVTGNTSHNIYASGGSRIDATQATLTGGGAVKIRCNSGSFINVFGATTNPANPGVPQAADANTPFNALTTNGIIFG